MNKVLFVAQHLSSHGGAERVLSIIANEVASRQTWEVEVLFFYPTEYECTLGQGVRRRNLYSSREEYSRSSKAQRLKKMRFVLREEEPTLVVPFLYFVGIMTWLASRGLPIRIVQTVRNNPYIVPSKPYKRAIRDFVYSCSWKCFVQNESQLEYFSKRMVKKTIVLPNPVSPEFLNCSLDLDKQCPKSIIMVGRLERQKNHLMAIEAASILRDRGEDFNMRIFGSGSYDQQIADMIVARELDGFVELKGSTNDVMHALSQAEIYVMTSNYEGMPNSLMEAMAMGLACVSTDCPTGPSDLIVDGESGFLVQMDDSLMLADRVQILLEDANLRKNLGVSAREVIQNHHSAQVVVDKFEAEFMRMA